MRSLRNNMSFIAALSMDSKNDAFLAYIHLYDSKKDFLVFFWQTYAEAFHSLI